MKRAVITGLGIVSSIGNNQQEVLASLREGRSGITFSQELKDSGMRSHVWGNVKLDTTGLIDRKVVRFMSDASIYAYLSMEQAVADAGLAPEAYQSNPRVGLIAGSGGGSPKFQVFGADAMRSPRGLKAVGPYVVTKAMASGVSACLATPFKIHGVNYSISSACATSAHCIGNAVEQIQLGKQDIVFAGGGEELCWEMACEFDAMGALSTKYNDTPEKASRTYDANRDGLRYRRRRRYGRGGRTGTRPGAWRAHLCRNRRLRRNFRWRGHGRPRLAKAQCAACRWRCTVLIRRSIT